MTLAASTSRALLALTVLAAPGAAQSLFTTGPTYPTANGPFSGELGDLNGDGHLDYVVANYNSTRVSVFLGTGTGAFLPQPPVGVSDRPRNVALGELDGDGFLDLVVVLPSSGVFEVLLGDGAGGFTSTGTRNVGGFPVWIELGRLDGDAHLDVAVGNQSTNVVSVLLGTGTGQFGPKSDYPAGYSTEEIALGDLEGDGDLDIVVGSWLDDRLVSLRGDGTGSFSVANSAYTPSPKSIALADMNGNGRLDVVSVSSDQDRASVTEVTSTGALGARTSESTGEYPVSVVAADWGVDGRADVVVACRQSDELDLLAGSGGAGLSPTQLPHAVVGSLEHVSAGDLNGDGIPDLVAVERLPNQISVHLGLGVGSFVEYCTGKLNSTGSVPDLYGIGTPSLGNLSPFVVWCTGLGNFQTALFIYKVGGAPASTPFQGGTLCIGPGGIRRTTPTNTGGDIEVGQNTGKLWLDFNRFALGLEGGNPDPALLVPGNTYRVQVWGRDAGDPLGVTLSDAIEVTPWL